MKLFKTPKGYFSVAAIAMCFSAQAKVTQLTNEAFTVEHSFFANNRPSTVHHEFSHIGRWWTSEYALSGSGRNLYFDRKCVCEEMPNGETATHMTFVNRVRDKSAEMVGAIGPLRHKEVEGKMNWTFDKDHHGTRVSVKYQVSGKEIAENPSWPIELDTMLEKQMNSFKASLRRR